MIRNLHNAIYITTLLITVLATSACTTPKMVDKQFGSSVRNMVKQQVYDPTTLRSPSSEQITGQNAQKAMLDQHKIYRTSDVSKQEAKISNLSGAK